MLDRTMLDPVRREKGRTHANVPGPSCKPRMCPARVFMHQEAYPDMSSNATAVVAASLEKKHVRTSEREHKLLVASEGRQWGNPLPFGNLYHQAVGAKRHRSRQAHCFGGKNGRPHLIEAAARGACQHSRLRFVAPTQPLHGCCRPCHWGVGRNSVCETSWLKIRRGRSSRIGRFSLEQT